MIPKVNFVCGLFVLLFGFVVLPILSFYYQRELFEPLLTSQCIVLLIGVFFLIITGEKLQ